MDRHLHEFTTRHYGPDLEELGIGLTHPHPVQPRPSAWRRQAADGCGPAARTGAGLRVPRHHAGRLHNGRVTGNGRSTVVRGENVPTLLKRLEAYEHPDRPGSAARPCCASRCLPLDGGAGGALLYNDREPTERVRRARGGQCPAGAWGYSLSSLWRKAALVARSWPRVTVCWGSSARRAATLSRARLLPLPPAGVRPRMSG